MAPPSSTRSKPSSATASTPRHARRGPSPTTSWPRPCSKEPRPPGPSAADRRARPPANAGQRQVQGHAASRSSIPPPGRSADARARTRQSVHRDGAHPTLWTGQAAISARPPRVDGSGSGARWQTAAMEAGLRVHEGGSGEPLLVLLHGLGATGDVWDEWRPLLARRWPGRWLAPDLPGHGGSPPLAAYTFDGFAAAVAGIVPPSEWPSTTIRAPGGKIGRAHV